MSILHKIGFPIFAGCVVGAIGFGIYGGYSENREATRKTKEAAGIQLCASMGGTLNMAFDQASGEFRLANCIVSSQAGR
jgi:hypothetical protein